MGLRRAWAHGLLLGLVATSTAFAQATLPLRRNETRPEIPDFRAPGIQRGEILPPVESTPDDALSTKLAGVTIDVTGYRFTGNTHVSDAELAEIARPYTNRPVTLPELKALRDLLTLEYVERGYVSSGVVLLEQNVRDGVVRFHVIEGVLTSVEVTTNGRFSPNHLGGRISRPLRGKPANISDIEQELQLLMEDERIDSVTAALIPDTRRGEAILSARIEESRALYANFSAINDLAPAVGGVVGRASIGHRNLLGIGDHARGGMGYGEGYREAFFGYTLPFNATRTRINVDFLRNDSEIVEPSLTTLDIESESQSVGAGVTHRVADTLAYHFDLGVRLDHRRSESRLLGRGFSFTPGPEGGLAKLTVARFRQDWTYRSVSDVAAIASTLSVGVDAFGATQNDGDIPDGRFAAWLGQGQWAHRFDGFGGLDSQFVARADLQLATRALLGLEQFAMGGIHTVRGYRQNAVVRDNGVVVSAEWRIRVWSGASGHVFTISPLFDAAHGWNAEAHPGPAETLASVGVGLGWQYGRLLRAQVYLAKGLLDVPTFGEQSLQDESVHVSFSIGWP